MTDGFDPYYKWLGIGPEEQPPHHYRLLGLRPLEADADVIEAAADRQMAHLQTYRTSKHAALSQKLLNEVSAARGCLLDPARKAAYDAALRARLAPVMTPPLPTAILMPVALAAREALPPPAPHFQSHTIQPVAKAKTPVLSWPALVAAVMGLIVLALLVWRIGSGGNPRDSVEGGPQGIQPLTPADPLPIPKAKPPPPSWTKGAVLALSFDADSTSFGGTSTVHDLSGAGNHGTVQGMPYFVPGKSGQALRFDTAQQFVEVPHQASLMPVDAITLAAWIKADVWRGGLTEGCILSKDHWGQQRSQGYVLRGGAGGRVDVTLAAPDWTSATTSASNKLPTGEWHHLAATYDCDLLHLFVDGEKATTSAVSKPIRASTHPLRIGAGTYAKDRHFVGAIDEVALWNRALTAEEIRSLYDLSASGRSYCREIGEAAK